jgi:signal transduction histidine kinase/ligand-binding sensor domain-containing protein
MRTVFTTEDGLPANTIDSLLQTRNGFLWIGSSNALARFDGRHAHRMEFPPGTVTRVMGAMAEAPDGALWVATSQGLMRIPSAVLNQFGPTPYTLYHVGRGQAETISSLRFSRDGVLWVGTAQGLYRFERGAFSLVLPNAPIIRIEESASGHLLVIAGNRFVELDRGAIIPHPDLAARLGVPADKIYHVIEDRRGTRWYCTTAGVARETNGSIELIQPYKYKTTPEAFRAHEDPQGNVWVSLGTGLFRATAAGLEAVPKTKARFITSDRDGNLWLGTNGEGLVRLKDPSVRVFGKADGLPSDVTPTVFRASDGRLWVGSNCGGLSLFENGHFRTFSEKDGLTNSCVFALAEDTNKDLWVGTYGGGAYRFHAGHFTQFSTPQGLPSDYARSIVAGRDGSVWIATSAGLVRIRNEQVRTYTVADGLPSNAIIDLYQDHEGVLWATTRIGLNYLDHDRFVTLPPIPGAQLYSVLGDDASGHLYVWAPDAGVFRREGLRMVRVFGDGVGMLPSGGDVWFCEYGISRIAEAGFPRPDDSQDAPLDYTRFGPADGLTPADCGGGYPILALTDDGKLWVATTNGLAMIDIPRLPRRNRQPTIYMEPVTIGRKVQPPGHELVLPPGTNHVELHFSVVELTSPERTRLQYRLDGVDEEWLDADNTTRSATYNNIPIGAHKFHVRACNGQGIWDRVGIVYKITQTPRFYQTDLFHFVIAAGALLLIAGAYRLRLRQMASQMNVRLDERVAERTRLARELHDTLLQTIQATQMVAADAVNDAETPDMVATLEKLSKWLAQAMQEARASLLSLRASTTETNDLAAALHRAGEECAAVHPVQFSLVVEGTAREMHPVVRDEVYRVAYEAIRNACAHSGGNKVEVTLSYTHALELRVHDDGKGIDPEIVSQGRPGHFGLTGMQERATRIGGKLSIRSSASAGTEVELIVPGRVVFRKRRSLRFW